MTSGSRGKRYGRWGIRRWIVGLIALAAFPALSGTGLPLPRFASLRANEVNLRTGPGVRYPVEWVFIKRNLPIQITAEFGTWRRIRDWQGTEGWVHQTMLSGKRTLIVTGGIQPLRRDPDGAANVVARAEERVIGRLLGCEGDWCQVDIADIRGWMKRANFWGAAPDENGSF